MVNSQSFYVSPSGNDLNSGMSPNTPWKTPQRAAEALSNRSRPLTLNATVHLAAGLYTLSQSLVLGPDTGGDGTTFVSWIGGGADGRAILSGAAAITGPWSTAPKSTRVFTAKVTPGSSNLALVRRLYCPDDECTTTGNASMGPARQLASTAVLTHAGVDANTSCLFAAAGDLDGLSSADFEGSQLVLWHAWATSTNAAVSWNASNKTLCVRGPLGDPYNPLAYAQSLSRYAVHNLQV